MRTYLIATLAGLLLSGEAVAAAKPKRCLSPPEIQAEQEVRHGIFLREAAKRCDEYTKGSRTAWDSFNAQAAPRFAKAVDKRLKAWQREFPEDWQRAMITADGRLVSYHRYFPLSRAYCESVNDLVQEVAKKGYTAFTKQAKTVQNEVIGDYKVCR